MAQEPSSTSIGLPLCPKCGARIRPWNIFVTPALRAFPCTSCEAQLQFSTKRAAYFGGAVWFVAVLPIWGVVPIHNLAVWLTIVVAAVIVSYPFVAKVGLANQ